MCVNLAMHTVPDDQKITAAKVNVFMPTEMRHAIEVLARKADRPMSREIRIAIAAHIERHRAEAPE
jgi:hypothetical protein